MSEIHRIAYAVAGTDASSEKKSRWRDIGATFQNKDGSETVLRDPPAQEEEVTRGIP